MKTRLIQRSTVCSEHGGVVVRAVIVVATLCIVGATIYYLLVSFGRDQEADHRKAFAISEYGLQVVLQQLQTDSAVPAAVAKTAYDKGWYRVTFDKTKKGDTIFLTVRSEGHVGSESELRECILRQQTFNGETVWIPGNTR